jgi:hypothetical protein
MHSDLPIPLLGSLLAGTCPDPTGKMLDRHCRFYLVAVLPARAAGTGKTPSALLL